ncbi:MAG: MbcA/ParS/Xre antitoxin family protein [Neomegalonema sp.]|nr:MbcA/ParS/Xre antitoxin family protein [Neomegalonema sp.]
MANRQPVHQQSEQQSREQVLTHAVLAASARLGLTADALARVLTISPAQVSRMKKGSTHLTEGSAPYQLGTLLVRLFRSLDAITGGDERVARAWMQNPNSALHGVPAQIIGKVEGLTRTVSYLDARRALL